MVHVGNQIAAAAKLGAVERVLRHGLQAGETVAARPRRALDRYAHAVPVGALELPRDEAFAFGRLGGVNAGEPGEAVERHIQVWNRATGSAWDLIETRSENPATIGERIAWPFDHRTPDTKQSRRDQKKMLGHGLKAKHEID